MHCWLSEEHFARLQPLVSHKARGGPRVDERRGSAGIIHVLQSGCRWRAALEKTLATFSKRPNLSGARVIDSQVYALASDPKSGRPKIGPFAS